MMTISILKLKKSSNVPRAIKNDFNEKKRLGKTTEFLISWAHKIVAPNVHLKLAGWRALTILSNFYSMFILLHLKYQIPTQKKKIRFGANPLFPFVPMHPKRKKPKVKRKGNKETDKIKKR
jgi:hypothetical protein